MKVSLNILFYYFYNKVFYLKIALTLCVFVNKIDTKLLLFTFKNVNYIYYMYKKKYLENKKIMLSITIYFFRTFSSHCKYDENFLYPSHFW